MLEPLKLWAPHGHRAYAASNRVLLTIAADRSGEQAAGVATVLPQHRGACMSDTPDPAVRMLGLTLRYFRNRANQSLRELGKLALYDYTRISRAENGDILIPVEQIRILDKLLGADGLLLALRQAAEPGRYTPALGLAVVGGTLDTEPVMLELRMPDGGSLPVAVSRRQFTQLLTTGALTSLLPGTTDPGHAQHLIHSMHQSARVDGEVIGYFRRVLAEHYTADQMLGPHRLLRPVLAQIEVMDEMRKSARAPHVEPLMQVLAQYAEMAGWLHQDAGDFQTAAHWSRRATEWAHCAGDDQMVAYMLVRQSNIACLTDDHAAVVQLAAAAQKVRGTDPKLTALANQQEARGHALLGDFGPCFARLDKAAELLHDHPDVSHPTVPVYLHHYDVGTLEEQSAVCYRAAGQGDKAADILQRKIDQTPPAMLRDRGHLMAKLAVTLVQRKQPAPDRAAELGLSALNAARQTGSARIHRELRTLQRTLVGQWPDLPGTRELSDAPTSG